MVRVQTGCRDCALCTGNAFTGFGRVWGRVGADVATFGISNLARRKCKGCGHPMAEHHAPEPQVIVVQQQVPQQAPQQLALPAGGGAGWYADPTDARCVCWWDGRQWHPETKRWR